MEAITETTHGIMDTLKTSLGSDDLSSITELFSGGNLSNSPMIHYIIENISNRISQKSGINAGSENNATSQLIPNIMSN